MIPRKELPGVGEKLPEEVLERLRKRGDARRLTPEEIRMGEELRAYETVIQLIQGEEKGLEEKYMIGKRVRLDQIDLAKRREEDFKKDPRHQRNRRLQELFVSDQKSFRKEAKPFIEEKIKEQKADLESNQRHREEVEKEGSPEAKIYRQMETHKAGLQRLAYNEKDPELKNYYERLAATAREALQEMVFYKNYIGREAEIEKKIQALEKAYQVL